MNYKVQFNGQELYNGSSTSTQGVGNKIAMELSMKRFESVLVLVEMKDSVIV